MSESELLIGGIYKGSPVLNAPEGMQFMEHDLPMPTNRFMAKTALLTSIESSDVQRILSSDPRMQKRALRKYVRETLPGLDGDRNFSLLRESKLLIIDELNASEISVTYGFRMVGE